MNLRRSGGIRQGNFGLSADGLEAERETTLAVCGGGGGGGAFLAA